MPLSKLPSGPSVAAIREPVFALTRCRWNSSFASRESSVELPPDENTAARSPVGRTRANDHRETGTYRTIAETFG